MKMIKPFRNCGQALKQGLIIAAFIAASQAVRADHEKDKNPAKTDRTAVDSQHSETSFIKDVLRNNEKEIHLGQMASQRAQNSQVKQFAERIVQDHTKSSQELKAIAAKVGVAEPTDVDHQAHEKMFSNKSGAEFDKTFVQHMIKGHKKGVAKFEKAASECQNAELKAFAQKTLPVLREHLQTAQSLAPTVGLDEKSISAYDEPSADRDAEIDRAVGAAASGETGLGAGASSAVLKANASKNLAFADLPAAVQQTITNDGGTAEVKEIERDTKDGKTVYKVQFKREGRDRILHIADDGSIVKDNKAGK